MQKSKNRGKHSARRYTSTNHRSVPKRSQNIKAKKRKLNKKKVAAVIILFIIIVLLIRKGTKHNKTVETATQTNSNTVSSDNKITEDVQSNTTENNQSVETPKKKIDDWR